MGHWVRAKHEQTEWDGYGNGWDDLRQRVLCRDGFRCQRCGSSDRTLQAHHVVHRSKGGPDTLENLITLCTPCHAVQHPSNREFAEALSNAPPFPSVGADERVAKLHPAYTQCARCETTGTSDSIVGVPASFLRSSSTPIPLCKPCAGVVCGSHRTLRTSSLLSRDLLSGRDILGRIPEASMMPLASNPPPAVAVPRGPVNRRERLVVRYHAWLRQAVHLLLSTLFVVFTLVSATMNAALLQLARQVLGGFAEWQLVVVLAGVGTVATLVSTALVWGLLSAVGELGWRIGREDVPQLGLSPVVGFGGTMEYLLEDCTRVVFVGLLIQVVLPLVVL